MSHTVVIGVGSNIDPEKHIDLAKERIAKDHSLLKESTRLQTEPVGYTDQADFINCCFLVQTESSQEDFNSYLHAVEDELGRVRTGPRFGPRTIDLDIAVWNGSVVDTDIYERSFLKNGVLEVLPELII